VASAARKATREALGSPDQSMKKPILVSLILLKHLERIDAGSTDLRKFVS